jgi:hypothetical protein
MWPKAMVTVLLVVSCGLADVRLLQAQSVAPRTGAYQAWSCGLTGLAATLTQCQALVTNQRLYITDVIVQTTTGTAGTFAIQFGTGTNCATGTTALFPKSGTADRLTAPINSSPLASIHFQTPLIPTVSTAICVIGTATNTISIQLHGYQAP